MGAGTKEMITMTTYPITREEIQRVRAWLAAGDEALLMLNRAGYSGSEYTGANGLARAVEAALADTESVRRVKDKIIARLHDHMDTDAATIRQLRHEVDVQRARAEVAEALLRRYQQATIRPVQRGAFDDDGKVVVRVAEMEGLKAD